MSLIDALSDQEEIRARTRRINGVAVGIVSDNKDPDGLGRIKVNFPWLGDDTESDWVKIATFMAGDQFGGFFLPEVGDEVLVAFEQGDINYPYVIGSLWNAEDRPPETNPDGNNNVRKIKSRSGHEITFTDDDAQQQEKLAIQTNAGHKIILDDTSGQEKIEIQDKTGGNSIVIDSAQNSITLESAVTLKLKAQTIEIESGTNMTIKANAMLTIQGSMVKIN